MRAVIAKTIRPLSLLLASVLFALLLLELMLRWFYPQELFSSPHELHPSGLYVNKSSGSIKHVLGGQTARIGFSEPHLRLTIDNRTAASQHERVRPRALFLGDSFTFGWLLNDADTFLSKIQKKYPAVEILNAGTGGYGSESQLKFLKLFCQQIKPQYVIFMMNFDDLERSLPQNFFELTSSGDLRERISQDPVKDGSLASLVREAPGYRLLAENLHLYSFLRKAVRALVPARSTSLLEDRDQAVKLNLDAVSAAEETDLLEGLLLAQQSEAISCGATPIFVYIGWISLKGEDGKQTLTTSALNELIVADFFVDQGVSFVDLSSDPAMKQVHRNLSAYEIPRDAHPNERGATQISNALERALSNLGVFGG